MACDELVEMQLEDLGNLLYERVKNEIGKGGIWNNMFQIYWCRVVLRDMEIG
jgi:hypothetical protein